MLDRVTLWNPANPNRVNPDDKNYVQDGVSDDKVKQ